MIVLGLTTRQPLWVILCRLPEKGRKEIEEMKERTGKKEEQETEHTRHDPIGLTGP